MGWDQDFFLSAIGDVAPAALINIRLALLAFALALLGGTALTLIRSLKIRAVNLVIALLISFIRGTPLMIQIFLFFYALPAAGIDLGPMTSGVLAIAFNSAMFITEIQRGSLAAIDPGLVEAGTALGLKPRPMWWKIILPQLFRRILPMLMNEATVVVKGTALLSIITVVDMMRVAQQIGAANFSPFEPLVAAAGFFLAINLVLGAGAGALERRFAKQRA